jgi:hypothetical protein
MYEFTDGRKSMDKLFGNSTHEVQPFKIQWSGREYTIKKVNYLSGVQEGKTLYHAFSVSDGKSSFQLLFHTDELTWLAGQIYH